ncbi:MAG: hypothetical protein KDA84_21550 [Planctomycetaceae bacterium]|nr:hypothetical protein [Planctomycetaceae bacterium]
MESLRGLFHSLCIVVAGMIFSPMCLAEDTQPVCEVPASIGNCHQPDFYLLKIEGCPEGVEIGQMPGCRFSAYRYRPNRKYHETSVEELIASLRPNVPICFFVHGAFVSWDLAAEKSPDHYREIVHTSGHRPLHFIAVHWPSELNLLPCPPAALKQIEPRTNAIGMCLARFLTQVPADNPVCFMGHSYGARVISVMLQAYSRGTVPEPVSPTTGCRRRIRVVLTAASINHQLLNPGKELEHAIDRVECLLNFTNCFDPALQAYALTEPCLIPPLGRVGFTCFDRMKLGWQADKVKNRNVSLAVGCGHMAGRYFTRPEVMQPMIPYIYFD